MRCRTRGMRCQVTFLLLLMGIGSVYIILFQASSLPDPANVYFSKEELEKLIVNKNIFHNVTYKSPFEAVYKDILEREARNKTLLKLLMPEESNVLREQKYRRVWTWANDVVTRQSLFPDVPEVDTVLQALTTARILSVDVLDIGHYESGTSVKWIAQLEGGQQAVIKLVWEEKGKQKKGGLCNYGHELPAGEIAGFYLHRLLGFHNTPYVSGRKINLINEILPVASKVIQKQITSLPGGDACVTAQCYLCQHPQRLCVTGGWIDASVAYWIPRPLKLYTYPPGYMPYSTPRMDKWGKRGFNNKTYCSEVRQSIKPYQHDWYYKDLFDFAVLDTLMYHYDTKHYVIYDNSSAKGLTIRLDHGRAFCFFDEDNIDVFLAPITQCCTIRKTTYLRLQELRYGNRLSKRLKSALQKDPLYPVLADVWYTTLERRLKIIFEMLEKCANANGWDNVLLSL